MSTIQKPLFRVDHVGSLVRPPELLEAFDGFEDGTLEPAAFRELQDRCIREAVAMQEAIGLPAVTDGEFRRRSYSRSIFEAVEGLVQKPGPFMFRDASGATVPVNAGYGSGRLRRRHRIVADDFALVQSLSGTPSGALSSATPKATLMSPTYFHFGLFGRCADPKAYPDADAFLEDLARIYREELADLAALGCTLVQLDEVPIAMLCDEDNREIVRRSGEDPERLLARYIALMNAACSGRPANMTLCVHLCRGNRVGMWAASGGYGPIAERLFNELDADVFLLEFDTERAGGFEPLAHLPAGKRALLGLVSTKRTQVESADELKRSIDAAARHAPLDRLGICPQCGFAASALRGSARQNPMTRAIQEAKLRRLVEVARAVWA